MNGDTPHVPITTVAGIASLTDLLNQLPLPSPLPATTTKSLLYNGTIAEKVSSLLACQDESLVSQLSQSLSQVSTEHIELKSNMGRDELEGDVPLLLQMIMARSPEIFREKNMPIQYGTPEGTRQPLTPQYSQNAMQNSPAATSNFQPAAVTQSPTSGFVPQQSGPSGGRFSQNSHVSSPYTPTSPAPFMQYPHQSNFNQQQQMQQQASVLSPTIPGGMRNIQENQERDQSLRNASVPLRSPQAVCSPGDRDGVPKASRPPLIMQSPPQYSSPQDGLPDLLLNSPDHKQKRGKGGQAGERERRQADNKAAAYDFMTTEEELPLAAGKPAQGPTAGEPVQEKDKPLKKRRADPHPQDTGATVEDPHAVTSAGPRSGPQEPGMGTGVPERSSTRQQGQRWQEQQQQQQQQGPGGSSSNRLSRRSNRNIPEPEPDRREQQDQQPHRSQQQQQKQQEHEEEVQKEMGKGPAPVVLVQKLSYEEVQKLLRDKQKSSRSTSHNRHPPERSHREVHQRMDSTPGDRKRRRGATGDRPKYAEVSSGEESDSERESVRKRHRRDEDRAWQYEETPRRGASSRSRYGDRSPDASDRDSPPPPSLSEIARSMQKKEKKRKAYEPKLTPEEMMDSSTFKRFIASLDGILENLEDVDFSIQDDDEIPQELLLGKEQLSELASESAKIKAMGITCKIPSERLVKVLSILEKNIQDGANLSTMINPDNDTEDEERMWRVLIMERVTKSADACLTALNIMTSPHMPKAVYMEDVIERTVQYTKFHLHNTLYPQYDPVYRIDPQGGGMLTYKAKRARCSTSKQRVIIMLYNKVCDVVSSISELVDIQLLTDTTILQMSSMGITPFFVENISEMQLCSIKLVTVVFSRYEKHRQLILEEIFTSLARLPTSKRSLRNFRLNSSDADGEPVFIQMVTALVLQLIHCVVHLPSEHDMQDDNNKVDEDVFVNNSYETAMRTAQNFLSVFLKKCGSKQGEEDYRPLFENFVQDLLSTVNKPEWPAAELLLSLLGRLLVRQFSNKSTEMALRVASLDYLGTVAARLRKDAITSKMDQATIDRILKETSGSDEIQQLQKALLDHLEENAETTPALVFARKFYIAQWFRDSTTEAEKAMKKSQEVKEAAEEEGRRQHAKELKSMGEVMQRAEAHKKFLRTVIKATPAQFTTLRMNSENVDCDDAGLIVRYLASTRPFAQSFDIYLTQILRVLGENAIAVRTKAMKCLSEVVAVDPTILARKDMQNGVHCRLMDSSTSVREAAVELLGRFVLSRPQLTEQYYDMLIKRILDTGISVRKRVIKILRDICLEQPTFSKVTEMCVKMIRRVNDEEGIKKLVNETFQKLWFTPTPGNDKEAMNRKILNITDVVSACQDSGYDWFEQLLQNLLKAEEDTAYKPTRKACVQLVDSLVEHMLRYEESLAEHKSVNSARLVACITTLFLFSKVKADFMVKHAMTMQPYLSTKCNSKQDLMVICQVAKILELVIPLMEHPSENFLATVEEDLVKLIFKYGMQVVQHCVSCLGAVVNKVTHNYQFAWACFNRFYGVLIKLKVLHQEGGSGSDMEAKRLLLMRSLFTVGAMCRHFDFDQEHFKGDSTVLIKDKVLDHLMYFVKYEDEEVQAKAILGLGNLLIMHPSLMFVSEVKRLYNGLLSDPKSAVSLKVQALKNLQMYLQEEDLRMLEADRDWNKLAKQEDLKEMGDVTSGMSSSIMQLYLKEVLEAFFSTESSVRNYALNVIALTLSQGLIHPVQCVPYLIAMGTDPEPTMRNKADQQLMEIDKKYTGFIHMKAAAGMKMSYQVQGAIMSHRKGAVIRGFRQEESVTALCSHLYSMVRSNRQHRRAFLISLLNLFDDTSKVEVNMLLFAADNLAYFPFQTQEEPLFIMHHIDIRLSVSGSNLLQTFKESLHKPGEPEKKRKKPRQGDSAMWDVELSEEELEDPDVDVEDEEEMQRRAAERERRRQEQLRRALEQKQQESDSDSDLEDADMVMERLPEDPTPLLDFARASQGILLLLVLKQHLKALYGFSDGKILKYSPTESAKVYDKAVNRKQNVNFNPKQTLEFLANNVADAEVTPELKLKIVHQFLDFKLLMEHLDPDEDEEDGEAGANARNKAINALLGGSGGPAAAAAGAGAAAGGPQSPRNHAAADSEEDESDTEDKGPAGTRRSKRGSGGGGGGGDGGGAEAVANQSEAVEPDDVVAILRPQFKDRPLIVRVVQKTGDGYSVQWMTGAYNSPWAEAKRREGRKLVPWLDTIKEADIIYKKLPLTANKKLTHKVAQTLRQLYAAKASAS
ncbi:nipped-B-like protein A isoform X2 [Engraulis encrasicolus]|uniref:nipped-B-like protein A isoform X2 n=1 Tax=Engraulis encrasicolus TaxID=184585 RepID=UPI002FCF732C